MLNSNHCKKFRLLCFLIFWIVNSFVSFSTKMITYVLNVNADWYSKMFTFFLLYLIRPVPYTEYVYECIVSHRFLIFRKLQWIRFSVKTPFNFLETTSISELGVNFKDACKRLWKVLVSDSNPTFGSLNPVKCDFCRQYTCTPTCIEERRGYKVAIDIGGKSTKIIREDFRYMMI